MPDFSWVEWGFVLAAAFCSGFLVRTFGAGVGLVITPFLIFAFSPSFSLGLIALFSCWSSLGAAPDFWGKWNLRYVLILAPGILIGLACGVWLLTWLPGEGLKLLIGAICFSLASYQALIELRGKPFEIPPLPLWQGGGFGVMSGLCSSLANSGAIFLTPVLISQRLEKLTLVSTIWALYAVMNPIKVVAFWQVSVVNMDTIWASVLGLPVLWLGIKTGAWVQAKLSGRTFNLCVLSIALGGSIRLILF